MDQLNLYPYLLAPGASGSGLLVLELQLFLTASALENIKYDLFNIFEDSKKDLTIQETRAKRRSRRY